MRLVRFFSLLMVGLICFGAAAQEMPYAEAVACPDALATTANVDCFVVVVPQDRANAGERAVRLMVSVYRARADEAAPDPLIFLDGGPGARTVEAMATGLGPLLYAVNRYRDVIVFDYRGMGYSDPALVCPESLEPDSAGWETVCRDRYEAAGVDMTDYTTRDNAADVADIVKALGYGEYNVWGGSYGSSVALTLLRDHPENVRAALVTALQPPQSDLQGETPLHIKDTLDAISALCAADPACAAAFPMSLNDMLAVIVPRLNENPAVFDVHGKEERLTGDRLLFGLGALLKDEQYLPAIPGLIAALYAEQDYILTPYVLALSDVPDPLNPIGAHLSMRCTDSILVGTPDDYLAAIEKVDPILRSGYPERNAEMRAQCAAWGARVPTEADRLPAVADTPVMIISGALDPFSSAAWLESALETLPNGRGYMLPYHMHYVVHNPCARGMLLDFLEDPAAEPDASCLQDLRAPAFRTQ